MYIVTRRNQLFCIALVNGVADSSLIYFVLLIHCKMIFLPLTHFIYDTYVTLFGYEAYSDYDYGF